MLADDQMSVIREDRTRETSISIRCDGSGKRFGDDLSFGGIKPYGRVFEFASRLTIEALQLRFVGLHVLPAAVEWSQRHQLPGAELS